MIDLVEGAKRQKTPNEIALTVLLAGFTLIFLFVTVTLYPFALYIKTIITVSALVSLFVCLIPTTIGGLLSAIGIAGMDRALGADVIAKSGKAVENAGDIDTVLLDKTGTITIGNRKATNIFAVNNANKDELIKFSLLSSLADPTPEGKSIVELAMKLQPNLTAINVKEKRFINFTAETRMSGVDLLDGTEIRKGAWDAIKKWAVNTNGASNELVQKVEEIASNGGTPLVVGVNKKAIGVIQLKI